MRRGSRRVTGPALGAEEAVPRDEAREDRSGHDGLQSGAHTPPLFGSTQAHFVGYVGCMSFPQSIRQGDTRRCDHNG